jgi:DNA-binding GntR family transcriptional regulator
MSREKATMSNEVHDVLVARWEGFKTLARKLPNRHVLAVELIRTPDDHTIAVFTTVRNGEPIRTVIQADAHGKVTMNPEDHCHVTNKSSTSSMEARAVEPPQEADPSAVALGNPPPKEPGTPGIVAVAGNLLSGAFDVAELINLAAK